MPEEKEEVVVVEEPVTPIVEMAAPQVDPVPVEELIEEEDFFAIEEREAMSALADMGRLFDDEDEERMI